MGHLLSDRNALRVAGHRVVPFPSASCLGAKTYGKGRLLAVAWVTVSCDDAHKPSQHQVARWSGARVSNAQYLGYKNLIRLRARAFGHRALGPANGKNAPVPLNGVYIVGLLVAETEIPDHAIKPSAIQRRWTDETLTRI